MDKELKVGIIGCGEIAVSHARSIADARNARIVMTMDVKKEIAKDLADRYQAAFTTDLDELLSNPDVDAVYIATPHYLHAPIAIKAADAGKHIMVEKPIAVTPQQARDMIEAADKNGVLLSVCFVMRYRSDVRKAKEMLEQGVIGDVIALKMSAMGDKPSTYWHGGYSGRVRTDWRTKKEQSGGGILIMNAVHNIDVMRFITGLEAVRVYAEYDTFVTPVEVEDWINVIIRYDNGAIGSIDASSCAKGREGFGDRIFGKEGQIALGSPLRVYTTLPVEGLEPGRWNEVGLSQPKGPRTLYVEEFAEAVLSGADEPPVTGEDGLKALQIITAAYESGQIHQPVTV
jgi:predicted dehydrogenase